MAWLSLLILRICMLSVTLLVCTSAVSRAHAQDAGSAEAFVRQLYVPYSSDTENLPNPEQTNPTAIFDPGLVALLKRDQATTPDGDEGLVDVDPICICQDWDHLRVTTVTVQMKGAGRADATVVFMNAGQATTAEYKLVAVGGQWRIHDIIGGYSPSFRQYLINGLAKRNAVKANGSQ